MYYLPQSVANAVGNYRPRSYASLCEMFSVDSQFNLPHGTTDGKITEKLKQSIGRDIVPFLIFVHLRSFYRRTMFTVVAYLYCHLLCEYNSVMCTSVENRETEYYSCLLVCHCNDGEQKRLALLQFMSLSFRNSLRI